MANHDTSIPAPAFPVQESRGGLSSLVEGPCLEGIEEAPASRRPMVSALEIFVLTAGSLFFLWYVGPRLMTDGLVPLMLAALVGATVYVACISPVWIHGDSMGIRGMGGWRTTFIRTDNMRAAAHRFGWITLTGVIVLVAVAAWRRPDVLFTLNWKAFWVKFLVYWPLALWQDGFFLAFFMVRFRTIFPCNHVDLPPAERQAAVMRHRLLISALVSGVFCLFHLPNPSMMLIALVFGFVGAWVFYAKPNLFVVLWCHTILGTVLHRVVGIHTRIGPFYWDSDHYVLRNLFPFVKRFIGDMF